MVLTHSAPRSFLEQDLRFEVAQSCHGEKLQFQKNMDSVTL